MGKEQHVLCARLTVLMQNQQVSPCIEVIVDVWQIIEQVVSLLGQTWKYLSYSFESVESTCRVTSIADNELLLSAFIVLINQPIVKASKFVQLQ